MPANLAPVPFALGTYQGRSSKVLSEVAENVYLESNPAEAKFPTVVHGRPGLRRLFTVGNGPCRGAVEMGNYLWVVSGEELYRVDRHFDTLLIGTVEGVQPCFLVASSAHIAIIADSKAYHANSAGIGEYPVADLVGAAYIDGYGVFAKQNTEDFYNTGVEEDGEFTTIDELTLNNADTFPDHIVGVIADHRELAVFGERSIEFYQNAGLPPPGSPFARVQFAERGCASGHSLAKANNSIFFLGDDLQFYVLAGYQPQPISSIGIHRLVTQSTSPQTARSFVYTMEGHIFYVTSFVEVTLVFDITTGKWSTWSSSGLDRWRAETYTNIWGRHIVGDCVDGRFYELDLNYYTDDEAPIVRSMLTPPIHANQQRLFMDELLIDMETGVGETDTSPAWEASTAYAVDDIVHTSDGLIYRCTTAGTSDVTEPSSQATPVTDGTVVWEFLRNQDEQTDPQFMLSWSDDAGRNWSNELWGDIGQVGETLAQVRWHNLGSFYERTFRFAVSAPVKFAFLSAWARMWAGE